MRIANLNIPKTARHFLLTTLVLAALPTLAQNYNYDDPQVHIEPLMSQTQPIPDAPEHPQSAAPAPSSEPQPQTKTQARGGVVTVPPGTKFPLALVRSLSLKHSKPGDDVHMQVVVPITVADQMVIPPGAYVEGQMEKITNIDKTREVMTFQIRSAKLVFATGYVATIPGLLDVLPETAQITPPGLPAGSPVPVLAAVGGPAPPPLPPLPPLPGRKAATVLLVGGVVTAVALVVGGLVFANHRDIRMEAGTPVEMILAGPLALDTDRVNAAVQQYSVKSANTPPDIPKPQKRTHTCWTTGSPGTPDTVIPGTSDTVIPGDPPTVIPGMPPTVIPGTPATDSLPYPCPN